MRVCISIQLLTLYRVARFEGSVYWGELAETCGDISRVAGVWGVATFQGNTVCRYRTLLLHELKGLQRACSCVHNNLYNTSFVELSVNVPSMCTWEVCTTCLSAVIHTNIARFSHNNYIIDLWKIYELHENVDDGKKKQQKTSDCSMLQMPQALSLHNS